MQKDLFVWVGTLAKYDDDDDNDLLYVCITSLAL